MKIDRNGSGQPSQQPAEQTPLLISNKSLSYDGDQQNPEPDSEPPQDETPRADEPSTSRLMLVMGGVWFGVFLSALDATIIATLSAPISGYFESGKLFSWLASAYLIANAAVQPLSGKLTDIFGRRAGLIWSNIFFLVGNLICGLAQTESVIILGRIVAGVGGGCINTIATFVASDLIPLRRRGLWQGIGNLAFGLGASLGGLFGGWVNDVWSWRWAFLIQIPFILISGTIIAFTVKIPVKETDKARVKRVDALGSLTLIAALVLLLLGLNSGGNIVPWSHPLIYVSLPLSVVFLALFIYVEDKIAAEPVLPVRLLLNRTVAGACLTNWFTTMAYFAYIFYAPMYFEARGLSASAAGLRLVSSSVGTSTGSIGAGLIMRATGKYYVLNIVLLASVVAGMALMAGILNANTPAWPPFVIFFFNGLGYGGMLTVTLLALLSAVEHEHQAVITSASYAFRSTGSTIGISVASAVFQNILKVRLWQELGFSKDAQKVISELRDNISTIKDIPELLRHHALIAYMDAFRGVWIAALGLCVLGAAFSLVMRENTLYSSLSRK